MANEDKNLPCGDWVFSNASNCSYARDRFWFGDDYQPIESFVNSTVNSPPIPIIGIGTVVLPVKTLLSTTSPNSRGTLRLANVLHLPNAAANVIGLSSLNEFEVSSSGGETFNTEVFDPRTGKYVAFFGSKTINSRLGPCLLELSEYPIGPRVAHMQPEPGVFTIYSATWPVAEQEKWLGQQLNHGPPRATESNPEMRLSQAESAWLQKHYRGEYKFLLVHGLSIYKEEDREEGRAILRAFMAYDEAESSPSKQHHNDEQVSIAIRPVPKIDELTEQPSDEHKLWLEKHIRRRWDGNVADGYFTGEELGYLKRDWGNSSAFIYSIGLNFYCKEDCEKAQRLAKTLNKEYQESEYVEHQVHDRLFSHHQLYYINRGYGNSALFMERMELDIDDKGDRREAESLAKEYCDDPLDDEDEHAVAIVMSRWNTGKSHSGPSKLADHFFSHDELDFVNKSYGDSMTFMICFGLKYYNGKHCRKAGRIVSFLMSRPIKPAEGGDEDDWTDEEEVSSDEIPVSKKAPTRSHVGNFTT
ncbi:hypothetical protein PT974_04386 [Cladobotryum mycophilum]|uniref:Uncharacterized protein n=1 Tax=Cladobotryum mycophilum TaxID=491253 RepID=A0ABR0SUW8_9HYPO